MEAKAASELVTRQRAIEAKAEKKMRRQAIEAKRATSIAEAAKEEVRCGEKARKPTEKKNSEVIRNHHPFAQHQPSYQQGYTTHWWGPPVIFYQHGYHHPVEMN